MERALLLNIVSIVISGFIIYKLLEMEKKLNSVYVSRSNVHSPKHTDVSESEPSNVFRPIPTSMEHLLSGLRIPSDPASAKSARVVELPDSSSPSPEHETDVPTSPGIEVIQQENTDLHSLDSVQYTATPETKSNVQKQHATRQRKKQNVEEESDEEGPP